MATIESRSLDFNLAEVRGNRAPKERSRFTARQVSAGVPVNGSESASSHDAMSIAAPSQTILTVMDNNRRTGPQWLCTERNMRCCNAIQNPSAHSRNDVVDGRTSTQ